MSVLPQFQSPMTQNAEEERRRRKDLPCSRLASEMILEGMDGDDWFTWKHIGLTALFVALLGAGLWYLMSRRHHANESAAGPPPLSSSTMYAPASSTPAITAVGGDATAAAANPSFPAVSGDNYFF